MPKVQTNVQAKDMSWDDILNAEKRKPYFEALNAYLAEQRQMGKEIFPPKDQVFHAFEITPFSEVSVVLLGQDPYHGPGQAHGLAFSVPEEVRLPPSLRNIFKELENDLGVTAPQSGSLEHWARQGVLLLNTVLTVEAGAAQSHRGRGWEQFTDTVIEKLSQHHHGLVFLLWGADAQAKTELIDHNKHTVLQAAHPSPLSAWRGFFGCKHFSRTNAALQKHRKKFISWHNPVI